MLVTGDSRTLLRDALSRSLEGQETVIGDLIPCPAGLSQVEKSAWLMLHNWATDTDLRRDSTSHADYSRARLEHFLHQLR